MPQVQVIQPIQQQPKRLRVAAYARVSSKSADQLNSMSVQVEYYTDLIQKNPNWEFVGVYADEGISGTGLKNRAGFNHLMDDCRLGLIDRILVKSSSRMARNSVDFLSAVRELKSLGVVVEFEKERFDTDSTEGELLLGVMCAVAQEESLSISKTCAGESANEWSPAPTIHHLSPTATNRSITTLFPSPTKSKSSRTFSMHFCKAKAPPKSPTI